MARREPLAVDTTEPLILTLWTDDPILARAAEQAGIQRVGPDLETLGKLERQRGYGTWISTHHRERLPEIRCALSNARLFARTNPLHPGSAREVEDLLALGVEVLMLPMFQDPEEVARFCQLVAGRATTVPLLETKSAALAINELVAIDGIEEIHIGINDLALSLGARMRFEVLRSGLLADVARTVRQAGLRLGIGALGKAGDRSMPIPSDLLYAKFAELDVGAALLARTFISRLDSAEDMRREVQRGRRRLMWWRAAGAAQLRRADARLGAAIDNCATW